METIDYQAMSFWWSFLQAIIIAFLAFYTWIISRTKANADTIRGAKEQMESLHNRITVIEHELEHVPGDQAVSPHTQPY